MQNISACSSVLYCGSLVSTPCSSYSSSPLHHTVLYSGTHLVPHYRFSTPLNWLIIKSPTRGDGATWVFFSNQGATRYGFTPILFNHAVPSAAIFFTSDPQQPFGWSRPESELASGLTTHLAVRQFRLGMSSATRYEYQHRYGNTAGTSSSIFTPPILWESLCSTQPNRIDYNLRVAFYGYREDLPAFYKVLNSVVPSLSRPD